MNDRLARNLLVLVLAGLFICLGAGASHGILVDPSLEVMAGKKFSAEYEGKNTILPADHPWSKAVNKVGLKIARAASDRSSLKFTFKVVDQNQVNAFALIGGHIYVTTELLKFVAAGGNALDENTLAAVLGHEVAHAVLRHTVVLAQQKGMLDKLLGAKSKEEMEKLKDLIAKGMTREMELEADHYGALYSLRAGYRFTAFIEFFEKMKQSFGDKTSWDEVMQLDHPPFTERIQALQQYYRQLQEVLGMWTEGVQCLQTGNLDDAETCFEVLSADFPRVPSVSHNLGVVLLRKHLASLPEGSLPDERIFITHVNALAVNLRSGDEPDDSMLTRAESRFKRAIELDPQFSPAYEGLGICMLLKQNVAGAQEYLEMALKLDPNWASYHNSMGVLLRRAGNLQNAAAAFDQALSKDREFAPALYNLAIACQQMGRSQDARALWDRYLAVDRAGYWHEKAVRNRTTMAQNANETFTYNKLAPERITSFAGVEIGVSAKKLVDRFGEPNAKTVVKKKGMNEYWSYPHRGVSFVISQKCVAVIVVQARDAGPVAGLSVGDQAVAVRAKLGSPGSVEREADGTEWWNYGESGLTFKVGGNAIEEILIAGS